MEEDLYMQTLNVQHVADEAMVKFLESKAVEKVRKAMQETTALLSDDYSLIFRLELAVVGEDKKDILPLVRQGIASFKDDVPYDFSEGSTVHKYLIDREVYKVPNDRCPKCWGWWDFKFKHDTCPKCGIKMGEDVVLLIQNNVCPECERGKLTRLTHTCDRCGFTPDGKKVAWESFKKEKQ